MSTQGVNIIAKSQPPIRDVEITREPVELYKILKFEGLVASGGEAKAAIASGLVKVNGEPETRKRRKIVHGDIIVFGDIMISIRRGQALSHEPRVPSTGSPSQIGS